MCIMVNYPGIKTVSITARCPNMERATRHAIKPRNKIGYNMTKFYLCNTHM